MELELFDIVTFITIFLISGLVIGFVLKKHLINILDPWIIVFLNQIIFISVIGYFFINNQIKPSHFYYSISCLVFFILGLNTFFTKNLHINKQKFLVDYNTTKFSIYLYYLLFIINGSLIFYFLGVPFMTSGNRTISAYSELGSGFGILNYLNWGLQSILGVLALKFWLFDKNKFGIFVLISMVIFNILNGGGKGVYLSLILTINLGLYYMHIHKNEKFVIPKVIKYALFVLPILILISFTGAVNAGYESNVLFAFIRRLIGAAEGPFFYFVQNAYSGFDGLNLFSYHFSQILPYFGYIDRNAIDLGVNLTLYSDLSFGQSGYGPNPTMYVIGHISMGNFGIFYCYLIGAILSYVRYRLKTTFIVWIYLNIQVVTLIGDGTLMPLDLFYITILSPILIWALLLVRLNRKEFLS